MQIAVLNTFVLASAALLLLERWRLPSALDLPLKGDIKRESWWLQQYGQSICTPVAALLVWELDPSDSLRKAVTLIACVGFTSLFCGLLKRLFGRVRPGREPAGRFLGPSFRLRGESFRHSFPSGHTACAIALSTVLTAYYPHGWTTFWLLAIACAALRYILDAHWPSDVVAGIPIGYAAAHAGLLAFPPVFDFIAAIIWPYLPRWLTPYL